MAVASPWEAAKLPSFEATTDVEADSAEAEAAQAWGIVFQTEKTKEVETRDSMWEPNFAPADDGQATPEEEREKERAREQRAKDKAEEREHRSKGKASDKGKKDDQDKDPDTEPSKEQKDKRKQSKDNGN